MDGLIVGRQTQMRIASHGVGRFDETAARQRIGPEPAALQLTRRADLLELEIPEPDLSIYDHNPGDVDGNDTS